MGWIVLVFASLLPAAGWVWLFYRQDTHEPEPVALIVRVFCFGVLAVVPAVLVQLPFQRVVLNGAHPLVQLFVVFFVVGVGEEFFKFLAVYRAIWSNVHFNEPLDGIVYAVTAGLGFATLENIIYAAVFGLHVMPIRAVVASLAHASFAGVTGVYVSRARFSDHWPRATLATGVLMAGGLHGLYDALLIARIGAPSSSLLVVAGTMWWVAAKIRRAQQLSPFRR